jgi:C4-dicarboxylate transporter
MKGLDIIDLLLRYAGWMKTASADVVKLRAAKSYLKGIKAVRLLVRDIMVMTCCVVFIGSGLALLPVVILLYAPWEASTKMTAAVVLLFGYVAGSLLVFFRMFSQRKWMQLSRADELMDAVMGTLPNEPSAGRTYHGYSGEDGGGNGGHTPQTRTRA